MADLATLRAIHFKTAPDKRRQRGDVQVMQHPNETDAQPGDTEESPDIALDVHITEALAEPLHEDIARASPSKFSAARPNPLPLSRRARLLPNLVLIALVGSVLLALGLWLGGFPAASPTPANQPTLRITNHGPYSIGSTITLQGQEFSHYAIIALLLDGQPAVDSSGQRLAINSDQTGSFSISLLIPLAWRAGDHILSAEDTKSQQSATATLHIENGTNGP
jgi:hypothetical protein